MAVIFCFAVSTQRAYFTKIPHGFRKRPHAISLGVDQPLCDAEWNGSVVRSDMTEPAGVLRMTTSHG
jgi:hypothetical protein